MNASLRSLDFDQVLEIVALDARSEPGRRIVRARRPAASVEECRQQQTILAEATRYYLEEGLLPFSGFDEIGDLRERNLDLEDSWHVIRAALATQAIREAFTRSRGAYPGLERKAAGIPDIGAAVRDVARFFTRDGKLREDATPALRSIRKKIQTKRQSMQKTLGDLLRSHESAIQESLVTLRGDRYCIPVKAERRHEIPGILHERSGSGATVFIEPIPVVELNNDLAELLIQEREEVARITRLIESTLRENGDDITIAHMITSEFDAVQACAVLATRIDACRPQFNLDRELLLLDARHPLLDERISDLRAEAFGEETPRDVVPTSLHLDAKASGLVISGPNAGGKTVALKTAGLLTAMAAAGLPIPAKDGSSFPVVDSIHLLIGDEQDVLGHLSTFSAYLTRLREILGSATSRSLVLLDEIGSGTDPEEGSALAVAVVEHLLDVGCPFIVTTHLAAMQSFAIACERTVSASMEFDSSTLTPTYRLVPGLPGRSRAIETAENLGLPDAIVDRAREILGERYTETDELIASLQRTLEETRRLRDELAREKADAERLRQSAESKEKDLDAEKARLAREWKKESEQLASEVRRRLNSELRSLKNREKEERSKEAMDRTVAELTKPVTSRKVRRPEPGEPLRVGDRVEHLGFGIVGTLESMDGGRAEISVRGRRMTVDEKDLLRAPVEPVRDSAKTRRRTSAPPGRSEGPEPPVDAELNVIGKTVDEAIDESDRFIDRALLDGKRAVRVIHGHGTGRLRDGLRDYLRTHPAVKSYRPGTEREGGNGATVVILDTAD